MRPRFSALLPIIALILCFAALPGLTAALPQKAADKEIKMGKEASKQVEKECKIVTDPKYTSRLEKIGRSLADIANTSIVKAAYGNSQIAKFNYTFKVVDDKTVNAFSLPGGYIYVNKGLLDYVQSDDELAAVLAHEVAHAAHHHMAQLLKVENKLDNQMLFLLLAGMFAKMDGNALANLMVGAQLFKVAKTNGYGRKAEADADATGVLYMTGAGYNPVGMLTFLERLAKDNDSKPAMVMGILQTHPDPKDRCHSVLQEIESLGLPVNRRAVTKCVKAVTVPSWVKGMPVTHVILGDRVIFDPAPIGNTLTSNQRAEFIASKINQFLDTEPTIRKLKVSSDGRTLYGDDEPILVITDEDCKFYEKTAAELSGMAMDALKRTLWREALARIK